MELFKLSLVMSESCAFTNEKGLNWVTVLFASLKWDCSILSADTAKLTEETWCAFPKTMVSMQVPLSVTGFDRPQILVSAVLFRNQDGLTSTAFNRNCLGEPHSSFLVSLGPEAAVGGFPNTWPRALNSSTHCCCLLQPTLTYKWVNKVATTVRKNNF